MSYFSIALQRAAESSRKSQTDIGNLSGVSPSFISRLMTADVAALSDKHFTAILKVFTPRTQAEIIAARCIDILAAARAANTPGAELVEISIKGHAPAKDPAPSGSDLPDVVLPHEAERAFAWLRSQCPVNPDLEKHLVGYAKMLGMK